MMKFGARLVAVGVVVICSAAIAAEDGGRVIYQSQTGTGSQDGRTVYTPSAAPRNDGFYLGFNLGQSQASLTGQLTNSTDTAFDLVGGFKFNKNLSLEASYVNLGKVVAGTSNNGRSTGFSLAGVASLPVSNAVSLYGKFGAASIQTAWDSAPAAGLATSQTRNGLVGGVGVDFAAGTNASIRVGYTQYQVGSDTAASGTISDVAIGVYYRF